MKTARIDTSTGQIIEIIDDGTPEPTVTAEQVASAFFSPYQIAALQRLEMALLQAGKPLGPKMQAAKEWLEAVMLGWAMNPVAKPQSDYGQPQATFEEASAEAVQDLASPNPET